MLKTIVVYIHLLATCVAIGTIVLTDLRLMAKVIAYRVVIPAPERFETRIITMALLALYITGGFIVYLGFLGDPAYLDNEKLQAKLVLVALLTGNAFVLHSKVFPILLRSNPVSAWRSTEWMTVAFSVSFSNSMWFYCAFLGVARIWNGTVPLIFVLSVAAIVWLVLLISVFATLYLLSRDAPRAQPDWVDSMKSTLSDFSRLRSF